jgi:ParB-like nuclease domain
LRKIEFNLPDLSRKMQGTVDENQFQDPCHHILPGRHIQLYGGRLGYYCVECLWEFMSQLPHGYLLIDAIDSQIKWGWVDRCMLFNTRREKFAPQFEAEIREHEKRVLQADISYPLCVIYNPVDDKYVIIDGCHRYVRLREGGRKEVPVVVIDEKILDWCCVHRSCDENGF